MADKAHRLTDEKLEEMEKRLSAIYSMVEKTVQKKMADYAKTIDEKSAELLQAYKDADKRGQGTPAGLPRRGSAAAAGKGNSGDGDRPGDP